MTTGDHLWHLCTMVARFLTLVGPLPAMISGWISLQKDLTKRKLLLRAAHVVIHLEKRETLRTNSSVKNVKTGTL